MYSKIHFEIFFIMSIYFLKEGETTFLATQHFKLLLRIKKSTQNIWFFNNCLKYNLILNYIRLKTNNSNSSAKKALISGSRRWLKEDRKIEYNKRDVSSVYLDVVHSELIFRLRTDSFDKLGGKVRGDLQFYIHKKVVRQRRKLRYLRLRKRIIIEPVVF